MAPASTDHYVSQLILLQDRMYAYILSLLGDAAAAEDVLQETNLAITRKIPREPSIDNFPAWACGVARFQVLAYRKKAGRDRLVFDDELVDSLADEAEQQTAEIESRRRALQTCLKKLSPQQRNLILSRYESGASVQGIAAKLERSAGTISQTLYRIRTTLLDCVRHTLAREAES